MMLQSCRGCRRLLMPQGNSPGRGGALLCWGGGSGAACCTLLLLHRLLLYTLVSARRHAAGWSGQDRALPLPRVVAWCRRRQRRGGCCCWAARRVCRAGVGFWRRPSRRSCPCRLRLPLLAHVGNNPLALGCWLAGWRLHALQLAAKVARFGTGAGPIPTQRQSRRGSENCRLPIASAGTSRACKATSGACGPQTMCENAQAGNGLPKAGKSAAACQQVGKAPSARPEPAIALQSRACCSLHPSNRNQQSTRLPTAIPTLPISSICAPAAATGTVEARDSWHQTEQCVRRLGCHPGMALAAWRGSSLLGRALSAAQLRSGAVVVSRMRRQAAVARRC